MRYRLLAALLPLIPAIAPRPARAVIEGYAWPISVEQGEAVSVHVSTDATSYDVAIHRIGACDVLYWSATGLAGGLQPVPDSAWAGCGWSSSFTVPVGPDWPSGVYLVRLVPDGVAFQARYAVFTVREDAPGSTARVLVQCSVATWQAYNAWGGRSLYDDQSDGGQRAHVVSFLRPQIYHFGAGAFRFWEEPLARWLEASGVGVEYCTDLDTHTGAAMLAAYDVFVVAGHDEYWSKEMRDAVDAWNAAGGRLVILGGNTCWWQIRFSPAGDRIVCYKAAGLDPLLGIDDQRVTVKWHDWPVLRPANPLTGASLLHGGDVDEGTHAYRVHHPAHWAFAGTGLDRDDEFGAAELVVDNEADGAHLAWQGGLPVATGTDGTPASFTILATSPASQGWATLGVIEEPGRGDVFNAASITWSLGLAANPAVRRITTNVLERFVPEGLYAPRVGSLVVDDIVWSDVGGDVGFSVTLRNDSEVQISRLANVDLRAFALGGGGEAVIVGAGEIGSLPPQETATFECRIPRQELPPSAPLQVAGQFGAVPGCAAGNPWRGDVRVTWKESGLPDSLGTAAADVDLPVCPGAPPSAVAVVVDVPAGTEAVWSFSGCPAEWEAALRSDESGVPGPPAPDPLPAGRFAGWITVATDAAPPDTATISWRWSAPADSGFVEVRAATCPCDDPSSVRDSGARVGGPALTVIGASPARGMLRLRYETPAPGPVRLAAYDVAGRLVRVLRAGWQAAGAHEGAWSIGRGEPALPGGRVVLLRLEAPGGTVVRKVVLLP